MSRHAGGIMNHSDFVRKYSFDNPLQRLVMLRILWADLWMEKGSE